MNFRQFSVRGYEILLLAFAGLVAVLGFGLAMGVPEGTQRVVTTREGSGPLGFAIIKRNEVELMLQSQTSVAEELPEFSKRPLGGTVTLYIEVADVSGLYQSMKGRATILKDLHTTFYGAKEFCIRDNSGYVLTFAGR